MGMTEDQQKEERFAAWDGYRAARATLLAQRARISRWNKPLGDLYSRVFTHPENAREDDFQGFPSSEEYASAVREMRQARTAFLHARKQAMDFDFTVEADEELIKG
jgi:3-methyladenine DNA glycosylase/8-oxoguanine DNA glycosylase